MGVLARTYDRSHRSVERLWPAS